MEAKIVSGLKRPAKGKLVAAAAAAGQRVDASAVALRFAMLSVAAVGRIRRRLGWLTSWAAGRSLAPNSLTGISLLFALCAAAWFSGGPADAGNGAIAVAGWLLVRAGGQRLAWFLAREGGTPQRSALRIAKALDGSTDWLVLPGLAWDDEPARAVPGTQADGDIVRGFTWLSAVCTVAAECTIYGGIAAGGESEGLKGTWQLAVMAIAAAALADLVRACRGNLTGAGTAPGPGRSDPGGRISRSQAAWRWTDRILAPSAGARVLIAMLGLALVGPRLALFFVLAVGLLVICGTIALLAKVGPADRDVVLALRDDGPVARWAGRLVQGNLMPLPLVFAGVIATALLAGLGLRNLPGVIVLTPPVVMMLAAPGSSHPHDGRFDWLAPVLIALGQYVYLVALGLALAVPGPAILAACALTWMWLTGLRDPASPRTGGPAGAGWEARMFLPGLAAILGLATFGYLGLAAYLGVLICRKIMTGYLMLREEDSS
ncbi:MAG TPA: hypothetical protein VF834_16650 [Streptosporangiaceae bacterium]